MVGYVIDPDQAPTRAGSFNPAFYGELLVDFKRFRV
jgi:hypothetical protein